MLNFIIVVVLHNQLEVLEEVGKLIVIKVLLVSLNCSLLSFNAFLDVEDGIFILLAVLKELDVFLVSKLLHLIVCRWH